MLVKHFPLQYLCIRCNICSRKGTSFGKLAILESPPERVYTAHGHSPGSVCYIDQIRMLNRMWKELPSLKISSFDGGIHLCSFPVDVVFLLTYCPGRQKKCRVFYVSLSCHNSLYSMVGEPLWESYPCLSMLTPIIHSQNCTTPIGWLHGFMRPVVKLKRPQLHESLDHK